MVVDVRGGARGKGRGESVRPIIVHINIQFYKYQTCIQDDVPVELGPSAPLHRVRLRVGFITSFLSKLRNPPHFGIRLRKPLDRSRRSFIALIFLKFASQYLIIMECQLYNKRFIMVRETHDTCCANQGQKPETSGGICLSRKDTK